MQLTATLMFTFKGELFLYIHNITSFNVNLLFTSSPPFSCLVAYRLLSHRLKKGCAYHLDLFVVGILNGFLSIYGFPWMHGKWVNECGRVSLVACVSFLRCKIFYLFFVLYPLTQTLLFNYMLATDTCTTVVCTVYERVHNHHISLAFRFVLPLMHNRLLFSFFYSCFLFTFSWH